MTSSDDQIECPLCMEPLEVDDSNFYPCTCGYQICRFCWHRLKTDGNGLCPACRKPYSDNPAHFEPLSEDEIIRIKKERRQKEQQKKQRSSDNRLHLADVRVVQKNLVFVVGLSQRLADAEVLKKNEYFGRFGKILKVVINQSPQYAGSQIPSASAYLTYSKAEEALKAIQTVNNIQIDNRTLKASLGTTKYCSHFLKSVSCPKQDCMYLHDFGEEAASFTKEEMSQGKHLDYESKLIETVLHIPKNMQNVAPMSGGPSGLEAETEPECVEQKKTSRNKTNGHRTAKSQKNAVSSSDPVESKLGQSGSATSLTVNTEASSSINTNLNTQSSSSSTSSSSSLTQQNNLSQQASPVQQQTADTNNNINTSNDLDLNTKNQLNLLSHESVENGANYLHTKTNQQSFKSQNNLFHEEDLGFDPLCESLNALQDLMQSENCLNNKNNSHTNGINYVSSRLANTSINQNASLNPAQLEYLQKQLYKSDLTSHTSFQNPSLESLLSLQHNPLLTNPLGMPTSLNSLLHLNHKPNAIVPPPGFANTKISSSCTPSSSNSTSTNSSASSSVNNSASSTPSMNNFVQNKNGSNGNLHALKSIFPNANISFGNNFVQSNQSSHTYKNMTSSNSNSYWPEDPAIISLTDHVSASNNSSSNNGISGLSDFSSNLGRSLSPAFGSQSNVKSSFYDNFSSIHNSYNNYQNYENIAKLQQLHQFMMQQQINNNAMEQAHHHHQLQMIKSLQSSNQNYLSNNGFNSLASLQQQLLIQQLSGFQMPPNSLTQVPTATKSSTAD